MSQGSSFDTEKICRSFSSLNDMAFRWHNLHMVRSTAREKYSGRKRQAGEGILFHICIGIDYRADSSSAELGLCRLRWTRK